MGEQDLSRLVRTDLTNNYTNEGSLLKKFVVVRKL